MTKDDAAGFLQRLAVVAETFNEPVSAERGMAYFQALGDLPLEALERGMDAAIAHCQFFPKPTELRDWARGRDPRLMDAARRRGWNPEARGFIAGYDGHGAPPIRHEPLPTALPPPPERKLLEEGHE